MPIISSTDKVLVTGANGYIGLWIVKTLLERGNFVRAAVRSEGKGRHLKELFSSFGDKLEIAIVQDMTKEGTWYEAVNGVQAIEHTASPVDYSNPNPNPEVLIEPATKGTLRILEAALKYKNEIKRVVITSSAAALASPVDPPRLFTEDDWNETAVKAIEEKGVEAGVQNVYSASKVLAERIAWDFVKNHQGEIMWDLTVIVPPMVFGPPLGDISSPDALNASLKFFHDAIVAEGPKTREMLGGLSIWVDVRDLAEAHVLALEKEKAGGERLCVAAGTCVWQDFTDVAHKLALPGRNLLLGFPDLNRDVTFSMTNTKSIEILGIGYRSKEDCTRATFEDFTRRGF